MDVVKSWFSSGFSGQSNDLEGQACLDSACHILKMGAVMLCDAYTMTLERRFQFFDPEANEGKGKGGGKVTSIVLRMAPNPRGAEQHPGSIDEDEITFFLLSELNKQLGEGNYSRLVWKQEIKNNSYCLYLNSDALLQFSSDLQNLANKLIHETEEENLSRKAEYEIRLMRCKMSAKNPVQISQADGLTPASDQLNCACVPLYSDDHYSFFSRSTHVISGMVALSPCSEKYVRAEYAAGVKNAVEIIAIANHATTDVRITKVAGTQMEGWEGVNKYHKIFPPDGADKAEVMAFYATPRTLVFQAGGQEYEINPVLLTDQATGRCYLHIELGKRVVDQINDKSMLIFCNNASSQGSQIAIAAELLNLTGAKQIIPGYPNKGINQLLNPDLSAPTTSIKGSVNPHLLAYNYLLQEKKLSNLEIYADSYGNLAAAQFINKVKEYSPDRSIFFIGSGTAASLEKVARAWVGDVLTDMAYQFNLLNKSDVFAALNKNGITSIIFNDPEDKVIPVSAQIPVNDAGNNITIHLLSSGSKAHHHYSCVSGAHENEEFSKNFKGLYREACQRHYSALV